MSKRARVDVDLTIEEDNREEPKRSDKCMQSKVTKYENAFEQYNHESKREEVRKQTENRELVQKHINEHKISEQEEKLEHEKKERNKSAKGDVDERVAESHRRFSAYIASWRQEVYSETQHGTPIIRKPSSLPPLSSLPLLLTSQHLALFSANTQAVSKGHETKHGVDPSWCTSNVPIGTHKKVKVHPEINNLVHDFFHSTSLTKNRYPTTKNNSYTNDKVKNKEYMKSARCTGVIYDTVMYSHSSSNPQEYERPLRLQRAIEHLTAVKLLEYSTLLTPRLASSRELRRAHSRNLIDYIDRLDFVLAIRASPTVPTSTLVIDQSQTKESNTPHGNGNINNNMHPHYSVDHKEHTNPVQSLEIGQDLYACSRTSHVARLAAGCAVEAALAVWRNEVANAFALIRPPGHHAMRDAAKGFCFYNNVAVAVRAVQAFAAEHEKQCNENKTNEISNTIDNYHNKDVQSTKGNTNVKLNTTTNRRQPLEQQEEEHSVCKVQSESHGEQTPHVKIMIIDWDVHHCDGTEDIFYNDDSVLVVSIHQHGNKRGHILRKVPTEMKNTNMQTSTNTSTTNNNNNNNDTIKFEGDTDNEKATDYLSVDEVAELMNTISANENTKNITAASCNEVQSEVEKEANDVFTTNKQSTRRRAAVDYNKLAQELDELNDANNAHAVNRKMNKEEDADADAAAAALFGVNLHSHHHHHDEQKKNEEHSKSSSSSDNNSTSSSSSSSWSSTYSDHVHTKDANGNNAVHYEGDSAGVSFDSFTASFSSDNDNYDIKNDDEEECYIDATSSEIKANNNDACHVENETREKENGSNDTQYGSCDHINKNNLSTHHQNIVNSASPTKSNNNNHHDDNKKLNKELQHAKQKQEEHEHEEEEELFYPASGHLYRTGGDVNYNACGRNINIPWPTHGMGDVEYMRLFYELILPAAIEFAPAMVFVSCGFDSANNDLLGSMRLTPSGYYLMTKLLLEHFPRVVVVLEGGYNARNVALCSEAVLRALLEASNCKHAKLPPSRMLWNQTGKLIRRVQHTHAPYWRCFRSNGHDKQLTKSALK